MLPGWHNRVVREIIRNVPRMCIVPVRDLVGGLKWNTHHSKLEHTGLRIFQTPIV